MNSRAAATAAGVVSALLVAVLVGCSGTPDADLSSPAPAPVARVTVADADVAFPRTLQADRLVEARVVTVRDTDAIVTSARLVSPLFSDSPGRESNVRLFPDWTNRVRVPLGTAVCPAPADKSTVELTIMVDGVETVETLAASDAKLREINAVECAQQAILDVAQPSFGPVESQTVAELNISIVLTRGDVATDVPVTLTSMTGNIVFIVTLSDEPRTLAPGEAEISVPAVISVGRCDPHVFAESKKTFVFPIHLAIGDADPAYVEIQPDAVTRQALQDLFDSCGEVQREGG